MQRWREEVMETPSGWTLFQDTVSYALAVPGPGLVLAGLWSAVVCLRARSGLGMLLMAHLIVYPAVLVGYLGYAQPRYLMPQTLTLVLLCAHAWRLHGDGSRAHSLPPAGSGQRPAAASRWPARGAAVLLVISCVHAGLIAFEFRQEPRSEALRWLVQNVPAGETVEYYQMINSLPGITAAGLQPQRIKDMTVAGFSQRRPPWACVVDSERWHWNREQTRFVEALVTGELDSLGYRRVRFGRRGPGDARFYLPHGLDGRLRPEIVILERIGGAGP